MVYSILKYSVNHEISKVPEKSEGENKKTKQKKGSKKKRSEQKDEEEEEGEFFREADVKLGPQAFKDIIDEHPFERSLE